jgi:hypothetical protein
MDPIARQEVSHSGVAMVVQKLDGTPIMATMTK